MLYGVLKLSEVDKFTHFRIPLGTGHLTGNARVHARVRVLHPGLALEWVIHIVNCFKWKEKPWRQIFIREERDQICVSSKYHQDPINHHISIYLLKKMWLPDSSAQAWAKDSAAHPPTSSCWVQKLEVSKPPKNFWAIPISWLESVLPEYEIQTYDINIRMIWHTSQRCHISAYFSDTCVPWFHLSGCFAPLLGIRSEETADHFLPIFGRDRSKLRKDV